MSPTPQPTAPRSRPAVATPRPAAWACHWWRGWPPRTAGRCTKTASTSGRSSRPFRCPGRPTAGGPPPVRTLRRPAGGAPAAPPPPPPPPPRGAAGADPASARIRGVTDGRAVVLGFRPALRATGPVADLTGDVVIDLLAVLGEALTNVARHAHAGSVEVDLAVTVDGVTLRVRD